MVGDVVDALLEALSFAFGMFWEILWALILGFFLSAVVQAVVSKREMRRLLPDDSPRSIAVACGLGSASSSCSYAAVALGRSLLRKGADFTASMAFRPPQRSRSSLRSTRSASFPASAPPRSSRQRSPGTTRPS